MATPFLSESWYRVAHLRPQLHPHVHIHRQRFRKQAWYILHDSSSGRHYRFTPSAYLFIHLMDGEHTVHEIWNRVMEELRDDAPTQDEVIQLLYQLYSADVLQSGVPPDLAELSTRRAKQARSKWLKNFVNPLWIKLPLWNPNDFLDRTWPYMRWMFSRFGLVLWLVVVTAGLVLAGQHWRELTDNMSDKLLAANNLFILWLLYPLVKFFHEMGHGYAAKSGGARVTEMGLMFLVLAPVPYVDASGSASFRSKMHRALVGAAGMMVELFLASIALFIWVNIEPGFTRSLMMNIMLIAGISTVIFNGNPLLRYDGYYILSDLIEIPNLGTRSNQYWQYLVKRYAFGKHDAQSPAETARERAWFIFYGAGSFIYRMIVMIGIALFVATRFFIIGVLLAIWGLFSMLILPLAKGIANVVAGAELQRHRRRAVGVLLSTVGAFVIFCLFVPMPNATVAEGVVWAPPQAEVRTASGGFVDRILVPPGAVVQRGQALLESSEPTLIAEAEARTAKVEQLKVKLSTEMFEDKLKAELTRQELAVEEINLARIEERLQELVAHAGQGGRWILPNASDLEGRYLKQGELVGYVLTKPLRTIRVVVGQDDIDLVRGETRKVRVKLADRVDKTYLARVVREVPGGVDQLPSRALSQAGGGEHAVDPHDTNGLKTLNRVFQFDLDLGEAPPALQMGTRAYVRFEHNFEPLAWQLFRTIRQLFLSHFNV